jgi:hypothetical protein
MTKNKVISIADRLRESRIAAYLQRMAQSTDHLEQRMLLARMECEINHRSPEQIASMERARGIA